MWHKKFRKIRRVQKLIEKKEKFSFLQVARYRVLSFFFALLRTSFLNERSFPVSANRLEKFSKHSE